MLKEILISSMFFTTSVFAKSLQVEATAYCACKKCCGNQAKGVTRIGTKVRKGVIAVDPKVIPIRSKVVINKEIFYAEDTGSAIKGNRIDIYCPTHKEALKFGRKKLTVTF